MRRTEEILVDFRRRGYTLLFSGEAAVETVSTFKYPSLHISNDLIQHFPQADVCTDLSLKTRLECSFFPEAVRLYPETLSCC